MLLVKTHGLLYHGNHVLDRRSRQRYLANMDQVPLTQQHSKLERIFFFSQARTRSNLFMKVLGDNPEISKIVYPFFSAYKYGPEPIFQSEAPIHTGNPGLDNGKETFQNAFNALITKISLIEEEGRIPFIMNHAYFIFDPDVIATNLHEL